MYCRKLGPAGVVVQSRECIRRFRLGAHAAGVRRNGTSRCWIFPNRILPFPADVEASCRVFRYQRKPGWERR